MKALASWENQGWDVAQPEELYWGEAALNKSTAPLSTHHSRKDVPSPSSSGKELAQGWMRTAGVQVSSEKATGNLELMVIHQLWEAAWEAVHPKAVWVAQFSVGVGSRIFNIYAYTMAGFQRLILVFFLCVCVFPCGRGVIVNHPT